MIEATGLVWNSIKRNLHEGQLQALAEWAFKAYFSEKHREKRWYRPDITAETVLNEFLLPNSPISPNNLVNLWKEIPSIRKSLGDVDSDQKIDAVADFLVKTKQTKVYNKSEIVLSTMGEQLGNISTTMIKKIFIQAAEKIRSLTGDKPLEDMKDEEIVLLMENIANAKQKAATAYCMALKKHKKDTLAFLDFQVEIGNLTPWDRRQVTLDEIQCLGVLVELSSSEIINTLLADLDGTDENIFKTFQNAVSRTIFSKKKNAKKALKEEEAEALTEYPVRLK